jgi:hypothetical protein
VAATTTTLQTQGMIERSVRVSRFRPTLDPKESYA